MSRKIHVYGGKPDLKFVRNNRRTSNSGIWVEGSRPSVNYNHSAPSPHRVLGRLHVKLQHQTKILSVSLCVQLGITPPRWRWSQQVPPKLRQICNKRCSIVTQRAVSSRERVCGNTSFWRVYHSVDIDRYFWKTKASSNKFVAILCHNPFLLWGQMRVFRGDCVVRSVANILCRYKPLNVCELFAMMEHFNADELHY